MSSSKKQLPCKCGSISWKFRCNTAELVKDSVLPVIRLWCIKCNTKTIIHGDPIDLTEVQG